MDYVLQLPTKLNLYYRTPAGSWHHEIEQAARFETRIDAAEARSRLNAGVRPYAVVGHDPGTTAEATDTAAAAD